MNVGDRVLVRSQSGEGTFVGEVIHKNDHQVLVMPEDHQVRLWMPNGYRVGVAHWQSSLIPMKAQNEPEHTGKTDG